jgi:hypothetical protein
VTATTSHPDPAAPDPLGSLRTILGHYDDTEPEIDDIPGATYWPSIPADQAEHEWHELRTWVDQLRQRFAHLDHHVIPRCWWQHNEHVEALCALRDHERSSYADTAPATAPLDWIRALRDTATLLRTWTADQACGAQHQDPPSRQPAPDDEQTWRAFVHTDVSTRHAESHPGLPAHEQADDDKQRSPQLRL